MQVSMVKRLKELERENEAIQKISVEQALDIRMLKDVNSKKWCAFRSDGGIVKLTALRA